MNTDLTTEQGVTTLMRSSTTEKEWNSNCDKVKQANGNDYPTFWFKACIVSGLVNEVMAGWKR
jgi:hypothetical protein